MYAEAIPKIQAQEAIQAVNIISVGSGLLKPGASQRITRQWEMDASRGRRRKAGRIDFKSVAAMMGIRVIDEDKK